MTTRSGLLYVESARIKDGFQKLPSRALLNHCFVLIARTFVRHSLKTEPEAAFIVVSSRDAETNDVSRYQTAYITFVLKMFYRHSKR